MFEGKEVTVTKTENGYVATHTGYDDGKRRVSLIGFKMLASHLARAFNEDEAFEKPTRISGPDIGELLSNIFRSDKAANNAQPEKASPPPAGDTLTDRERENLGSFMEERRRMAAINTDLMNRFSSLKVEYDAMALAAEVLKKRDATHVARIAELEAALKAAHASAAGKASAAARARRKK